ncbi:hypothetical protein [Flavisolibacter nicotianae]|uniref:hypothetical protein n=1 Tax=Flavisolibacter nicotianae TaxID=2364882 RepID=UPI000EABA0F1|nr:hypothetical protein [Flavisolibacter nicotianae]
MKKLLATSGILFLLAFSSQAQCEKSLTLTSAKTEFIDSEGKVADVKDLPTTVELTPRHIIVRLKQGDDDIIEGDVKNLKCNWKEAYKSGQVTFGSLLAKTNGETREATFVLEAKDGKLFLTVAMEKMSDRKMRLQIDSYKESR